MKFTPCQTIFTGCIAMILGLTSCGLKTYRLLDGRTKVPLNTSVFTKRSLFDKALVQQIDTAAIYEAFSTRYGVVDRLDNHVETVGYGIYKFYNNGCLNEFLLDRSEYFEPRQLDPSHRGYQGVYYIENGKFRIQLCGTVDEMGGAGLLYSTLRISGDTIFEKRDDLSYENIYIKRILPVNFLIYTPYW